MSKPTLEEFLSGRPLKYWGFSRKKKLKAVYTRGKGIEVFSGDDRVTLACVPDDDGARRFYANSTREPGEHE